MQLETDAKSVFTKLLDNDSETRLAIRSDPSAALAALQQGEQKLGLSQQVAAKALDEVLDAYRDPVEARTVLDANMTIARQAELIEAGGDLDRAAADIVGLDTLHVTLLGILLGYNGPTSFPVMQAPFSTAIPIPHDDIQEDAELVASMGEEPESEEDDEPVDELQSMMDTNSDHCIALYRFARKLRGNPCYQELLEVDLGGMTLREHLAYAAWDMADRPNDVGDISPDLFDSIGLDRDLCIEPLRRFLADQRILDLNLEDAVRARQEILMKHNGSETGNAPDQTSSAEPMLDLG